MTSHLPRDIRTPDTRPAKAWVISDGRGITGNLNGCLGVAHALSPDVSVHDLQDIRQAGGIEPYLRRTLGEDFLRRDRWPDYTISFYRNTAPVAAELKRLARDKTGKRVVAVQVRSPGEAPAHAFDVLAQPCHEEPIPGSNVVQVMGVPHDVTAESMRKGYERWHHELDGYRHRHTIAVLLGGDVPELPEHPGQGGSFSPEQARALGRQMNALAKERHACLLVTNSPRTSPAAWQAFMEEVKDVDGYFHDFHRDPQRSERGNPYQGMLHAADEVVITADSISMGCEAATSGKPLYLACTQGSHLRDDHRRFCDVFHHRGHADLLEEFGKDWHRKPRPGPLDVTGDIAAHALEARRKAERETRL